MLIEIGLVLALYVVARLTFETKLAKVTAAIAIVASVLAVIDFAAAAFTQRSIAERVRLALVSKPSSAESKAPSTGSTARTTLAPGVTVTRGPGGSIQTPLGYGIVLAKDSSLQREWIAVHDASVPFQFDGTPGVTTAYKSGGAYSNGEYRYVAKFALRATANVRAVQVRFLTFDVWGSHVQTLSYEDAADVANGTSKDITAEWRLFSENDAEKFYASIAYVSRVRLEDGRVVAAKDEPVIEEAQKFSTKFTAQDLEPGSKPPQSPSGAK